LRKNRYEEKTNLPQWPKLAELFLGRRKQGVTLEEEKKKVTRTETTERRVPLSGKLGLKMKRRRWLHKKRGTIPQKGGKAEKANKLRKVPRPP